MMPNRGIVVVGGSLAGARAVESARRAGFAGKVTLIEAGEHEPYDRPPLSKEYLASEIGTRPPKLLDADAISELDLDLRCGERAVGLDSTAKILRTSNAEYPYERLLVATGASARQLEVPGSDLRGIHYLRSLDDAISLRASIGAARRAVVVGAGFIGMEVASSLLSLGLAVTVLERESTVFPSLGTDLGDAAARRLTQAGGILEVGVVVDGFAGVRDLAGVLLSDGRVLKADIAVVGVGATPNIAWLAESGVATENGVVCSATLESNVPGVYAAGDVANWPSRRFGERIRVEHWTNAVMQGVTAGHNLAGKANQMEFDDVPYFWSDFLGTRIQVAGRLNKWDECRQVASDETGHVNVFAFDGRIVAVAALDARRHFSRSRRLIGEKVASLTELPR
ncbi:NAD(P)/FAD-dependent oxidoreductase [Rhodococcus erythropolis]|uniref:NAD(P)/FAD-dependent oxidoreductase n=2 Tax=Rhodococcus erythropolis TaxID=1833 RepID=UPI003D151576